MLDAYKRIFLKQKKPTISQQEGALRPTNKIGSGKKPPSTAAKQLDIFEPGQAEKIVNMREEVRRALVNDKISADEFEKCTNIP